MGPEKGEPVEPHQAAKTGGALPSRTGRLSAVGSLPRRGAEAGELPKKHYTGQGHSRVVLERGRLEKEQPRNWKSEVPWFPVLERILVRPRQVRQRPQEG